MSPLHHREPGAVGALLSDGRLRTGIIADGVHVDPAAVRIAYAAKGADGLALGDGRDAGGGHARRGLRAERPARSASAAASRGWTTGRSRARR